jgi:hypothetical protein
MSVADATELFVRTLADLKNGQISFNSPLEEIVIKECGKDLAYIDDRRSAKQKYNFDFWNGLSLDFLKSRGIDKRLLYTESQQFPDFLFKAKKRGDKFIDGSLMELKDSKGGSISSFNSTIPTRNKTLEEVDVINGNNLVSKIARALDSKLALNDDYCKFERRCFYFVRTFRGSNTVKISVVDGAFFETVPKGHLFYQMLLNVYREHLKKKEAKIPQETIEKVEEALKYVDDQTIIAKSQIIEKASIRPRLRIMAEVHPEGNPHSTFYPEISEGSFNLILQSTNEAKQLQTGLCNRIPDIEVFSIHHKRNGEHLVFQFKSDKSLTHF